MTEVKGYAVCSGILLRKGTKGRGRVLGVRWTTVETGLTLEAAEARVVRERRRGGEALWNVFPACVCGAVGYHFDVTR